jgi:hypothetical protein
MNDGLIASIQQDVSNRRFNLRALGDGEEMVVALCLCELDEVSRGQPAGVFQNGPGDPDFGMTGQAQREINRGIGDWCEPLADLCQRARFYSLDQLNHNQVENADLFFAQTIGFGQERIRDLPQHAEAFIR